MCVNDRCLFLGHQTTKQQIVEQKSEVRQLKDTLQHEKETNETLNKRVQRQSKTVIADEEKQIRETAHRFTTELFTLKKVNHLSRNQKY